MSETRNKVLQYKEVIYKLYSVEGRSLNYISNLLDLNRRRLTEIVKNEWCFNQANVRVATPRIKKLINKHKYNIISYCSNLENRWLSELYADLGITAQELCTMRQNDKDIDNVVNGFTQRKTEADILRENRLKQEAMWEEELKPLDGEVWKDVLGYEGIYQVSNLARIRNVNRLVKPQYSKNHGRYEISLSKNGRVKNHKRYRLVALAFLDNPDNLPTVNHKDGDCTNDVLSNLEWSSYAEQNHHRIYVLEREIAEPYKRNGKFKQVKVDDKYTFKSIAAAARFLGVSETQMQRYISGETPFNRKIELIY